MRLRRIFLLLILAILIFIACYEFFILLASDAKEDLIFGYIDKKGDLVIEPKYYNAMPFSSGLAAIQSDPDTIAFINKTGIIQIDKHDRSFFIPDPSTLAPYLFHENYKSISFDGKQGFIDKEGNIVIKPRFDTVTYFSEGLAAVQKNQKWGYIDNMDAVVIELKYEDAGEFSEDLAYVQLKDKYGFINKAGECVIEPLFDKAWSFYEGMAVVEVGGKHGYINHEGKIVIEPQFDHFYGHFKQGMAMVAIGNRWYFIDEKGKVAIDLQPYGYTLLYNLVTDSTFYEGISLVKDKDDSFVYIDKTGKPIIEKRFSNAHPFSEGLAAVEVDGRWGYINKIGDFVITPQFNRVGNFSEGMSFVALQKTKTR
ncbi:MAG: WG repeat-containing protein [Sedimentisphaerales bacterium]|nr:WG repeat-containing protein [Sedimentisphaerales bacterium]